MDFRRKSKDNYSSNFMNVAIDKKGNEGIYQYYNKLPYHLWHYQYFKQNACNFCDDIFGELADVTFMDAWLPEYIKDYRGTSLVIARTPLVIKILENSQECTVKHINVNEIIKSQRGVIHKKRILLKGRLFKYSKLNTFYPKKRIKPDIRIYNKNKEFIDLTTEIQNLSKEFMAQISSK